MNTLVLRMLILFLVSAVSLTVRAQTQNETTPAAAPTPQQKVDPPIRLPKDLVDFFSGEWIGAGEFANGKKINADVAFTPSLDNQWLAYRHTDRSPNIYKAMGMWGYEFASKTFIMILNDNFGGLRLFTSGGWVDGKLTFVKSDSLKLGSNVAAPLKQERFIFERQDDRSFKMTYEISADGTDWRIGDYLIFKKN
ncbi:MAG TPA: hypothetical protein VEV84_05720 [Pyrinomonadaceae bacterium]|nr:hypothetical protein [Pyrinomonadaceae bacterium]